MKIRIGLLIIAILIFGCSHERERRNNMPVSPGVEIEYIYRVRLVFTAPLDVGHSRQTSEYDIRVAADSCTFLDNKPQGCASWNSAFRLYHTPPKIAGQIESTFVELKKGDWYFAIKVKSTNGNWSAISRMLKITLPPPPLVTITEDSSVVRPAKITKKKPPL